MNEAVTGADLLREMLKNDEFAREYESAIWYERLINRMAEERNRAGLTQKQVAQRMKTTQSAVSALETAGNDPRISTILRYASAIEVEITATIDRARPISRLEKVSYDPATRFDLVTRAVERPEVVTAA